MVPKSVSMKHNQNKDVKKYECERVMDIILLSDRRQKKTGVLSERAFPTSIHLFLVKTDPLEYASPLGVSLRVCVYP